MANALVTRRGGRGGCYDPLEALADGCPAFERKGPRRGLIRHEENEVIVRPSPSGWLALSAPPPRGVGRQDLAVPGLLERHAGLAGPARYALVRDRVRLVADVPPVDRDRLPAALSVALASMVEASARLRGVVPTKACSTVPPLDAAELEAWLEATGLVWRARDAGVYTAALDTEAYLQRFTLASVAERGALVVESELVSWAEIGEEAREALATFLLRVGGELRVVRAVFAPGAVETKGRAALEVVLAAGAPAALRAAIEGLVVGARLTRRECAALVADGALARAYRGLQGRRSRRLWSMLGRGRSVPASR